jgi:hypothetical protein
VTPLAFRLAVCPGVAVLTCTWHNTTDRDVTFGPETTDEMCFAIGFYYRDADDTTPVSGAGCLPSQKGGLLCPLAPAVAD